LIAQFLRCACAVFAVYHHLDLAFLGPQHDRLLTEPPDHVERALWLSPQRQLLHILRNAPLDHGTQFLRDREESIRRTQPVQ